MASSGLWKTLRIFNYNRCIPCNFSSLCANRQTPQVQVTPRWVSLTASNCSDIITDDPVKPKKKKEFIPRITLLHDTDDIMIVTLEEAEKLAKRRSLKLVKIVDLDTKTDRPVYKLMKMRDFLEEEARAKAAAKEVREKTIKEDKTITLSSKIAEHDLNIKIRSMQKMLGKRHGVRVVVSVDGNKEKAAEVREYVMQMCKDIAKPLSKVDSTHNLRVTLRPILEKIEDTRRKSTDDTAERKGSDH